MASLPCPPWTGGTLYYLCFSFPFLDCFWTPCAHSLACTCVCVFQPGQVRQHASAPCSQGRPPGNRDSPPRLWCRCERAWTFAATHKARELQNAIEPGYGAYRSCNGHALDRVARGKHGPHRQNLSKKDVKSLSSQGLRAIMGQYLDIFQTFFDTIPFSGLSNDLPVTIPEFGADNQSSLAQDSAVLNG